jgi:hypothetical protein
MPPQRQDTKALLPQTPIQPAQFNGHLLPIFKCAAEHIPCFQTGYGGRAVTDKGFDGHFRLLQRMDPQVSES